jgi:hypothetical protein
MSGAFCIGGPLIEWQVMGSNAFTCTCTRLESVFSEWSGFKPYRWQLDCCVCMIALKQQWEFDEIRRKPWNKLCTVSSFLWGSLWPWTCAKSLRSDQTESCLIGSKLVSRVSEASTYSSRKVSFQLDSMLQDL